jgi:ATP synthase protein I
MFKLIWLQILLAVCAVVFAAMLWGWLGAGSAAAGAAACILPTSLFAWLLKRALTRPAASMVLSFFVGEAVKIVAVIGCLVLVRLLYPGAHWGAVVMAMAITLQANFLALKLRI